MATFAEKELAAAAVREIGPAWSPRATDLVGDAWRDEWKKHFVPFRLTPRITVRPPWEAYQPRDASEIVLDFSSLGARSVPGSTPPPRWWLVHSKPVPPSSLASNSWTWGPGAAFSRSSRSLGAARVRAIDIDPDAAEVTLENAQRNGLRERVEADTAPLEAITRSYPW